jgi:hypothetical protein
LRGRFCTPADGQEAGELEGTRRAEKPKSAARARDHRPCGPRESQRSRDAGR